MSEYENLQTVLPANKKAISSKWNGKHFKPDLLYPVYQVTADFSFRRMYFFVRAHYKGAV
jgi:hypothetical protein